MKTPNYNSTTDVQGQRTQSNGGATGEFQNFVADIEDLLKSTTSLTGDDLLRAKAELNARVAAAKASIEEMSNAVTERARRGVTATNDYVHDNPWQAVGIGAALGLFIGFALARRQ